MNYKVIDKLRDDKVLESHTRPFDAQRALHILTAHELKNGRKAHYAIEPPIIEACPPTIDELNLPSWAYDVLMADQVEISNEVNAELDAEEKAGNIVAKQVREGRVKLGEDGEVLSLDDGDVGERVNWPVGEDKKP